MKPFRRRSSGGDGLSRSAALTLTPVRNTEVGQEPAPDGGVVLSYPVVMRPWFAGVVRRLGGPEAPVRTRKLQLDALGTSVWELIDGMRTVRQVVRDFADIHQIHPREAEVSVTLFLRNLGKRGIIGLK